MSEQGLLHYETITNCVCCGEMVWKGAGNSYEPEWECDAPAIYRVWWGDEDETDGEGYFCEEHWLEAYKKSYGTLPPGYVDKDATIAALRAQLQQVTALRAVGYYSNDDCKDAVDNHAPIQELDIREIIRRHFCHYISTDESVTELEERFKDAGDLVWRKEHEKVTALREQLAAVTAQRDALLEVASSTLRQINTFMQYEDEPSYGGARIMGGVKKQLQAAIDKCEAAK